MDEALATTYKLPILPAIPSKGLEGKEITQEMIDSALAYNPAFRPSYVYLNEEEAHNRAGKSNGEVLAQILRTFKQEIDGRPHVVAEVLPQRKYRENGKFEELAAPDGSHPGRSVDLWGKKLIPGCQTDFYLEGIALCGAQKPATVNLPSIYYSTQLGLSTVTFSINFGLTGEENMENKEEKVDLSALKTQVDDLKAQLSTAQGKLKLVEEERDHYKNENVALSNRVGTLEDKFVEQEVSATFERELVGKLNSEEYEKRYQFGLKLRKSDPEAYADYIDSLKSRQPMINLAVVGGHLPNNVSNTMPMTPNQAITQFAAEAGIDPDESAEAFNKAEIGARKKYPAAFGIKEGVR